MLVLYENRIYVIARPTRDSVPCPIVLSYNACERKREIMLCEHKK